VVADFLPYIVFIYGQPLHIVSSEIFVTSNDPDVYRYFNPDEILQMVSFIIYIRFAAYAMDLDRDKEKYALLFFQDYSLRHYFLFSDQYNFSKCRR
jgi:hypothetical protein